MTMPALERYTWQRLTPGTSLESLLSTLNRQEPRVQRALADLYSRVENVLDFSAVGNGLVDDTAAIQQRANTIGAAGGGILWFPPTYSFKLTAEIAVPANCIVVAYGATITQATADKANLIGPGISGIYVLGGKWIGPGQTSFTDPNKGTLYFYYANSTMPTDIRIHDVEVSTTGGGISTFRCGRVWVRDPYVHDYGGTTAGVFGVQCSEAQYFHITKARVRNCTSTGIAVYGITGTGNNAGGIIESEGIIDDCLVEDIPAWTAVMAHDVDDIKVTGLIAKNVRNGVQIGYLTNSNVINRAQVTGSTIYGTATDAWSGTSATHVGIAVQGFDSTHRLTGAVIGENTIDHMFNIGGSPTIGGVPGCLVASNMDNLVLGENVIQGTGSQTVSGSATSIGLSLSGTINQASIGPHTISGSYDFPIYVINATVNALAFAGGIVVNDSNNANAAVTIYGSTVTQLAWGQVAAPNSTTIFSIAGGGSVTAYVPWQGQLSVNGILTLLQSAPAMSLAFAGNADIQLANASTVLRIINSAYTTALMSLTQAGHWTISGAATIGGTAQIASLNAFVTGDKYVIADASGNLHLSSLGPAS